VKRCECGARLRIPPPRRRGPVRCPDCIHRRTLERQRRWYAAHLTAARHRNRRAMKRWRQQHPADARARDRRYCESRRQLLAERARIRRAHWTPERRRQAAEYERAWRRKHPKKKKAAEDRYRERHRARLIQDKRRWRAAHLPEVRAAASNYYVDQREEILWREMERRIASEPESVKQIHRAMYSLKRWCRVNGVPFAVFNTINRRVSQGRYEGFAKAVR
jgi:hypothetical protein